LAAVSGGDHSPGRDAALLDSAKDAARVRRGVGRLILSLCEDTARSEGFGRTELCPSSEDLRLPRLSWVLSHETCSGAFAQRFFSSPDKKDGLYWKTAEGEDQSPLGELFADASAEGYKAGEGPTPYHGYYYKILTKQGPAAAGGAADYIVNEKMIGGFALVAYPAEYRNSGVMTFVVNYSGVLYQKDFGPNTATIAAAMAMYNPDSTWAKVDAADETQ
jgi:Protein of unknown function (DUF2950)